MATAVALAIFGGVTTLYYGMPNLMNTTMVKSTIDDRMYKVINRDGKQEAADTLARLRGKMQTFLNYLNKTYKEVPERKEFLEKLKMVDLDAFQESPEDSHHEAFSLNKGEEINLCVRDTLSSQKIQKDMNTLVYVALHEIAHVITVSVGHTAEFWKNHETLVNDAIDAKIYTYVDYSKFPVVYCGKVLNSAHKKEKRK